ncbi:D-alanyl-D-alanine carboxypeptidase / D-alanyl-D-alanine-endopeptidase (penicillin-binding protein 4) [Sulfitobacter brevis]|uniref:D-alanyl-D-alanine carboxypeptidase / D-alanyl-D-alanine-endopeptidase (Penicillin-binding protein 4) n=1 Tax=Sulfitobacter brevis TaxID=74348 RepID=A0A1I1SWL3_9RHOB|nr:D-alanyl-D-alanine carboxypeptidase/D-alanyl-D-alanine-endopeptidase [Sulfitobacter brevis]SFD50752.1 D-alanyl-D-alanine carboxypeptidase / D-alanyl-D-alanine-endopeptidase (penicillin-binding protein 4) [Sulfitobacter brevis]
MERIISKHISRRFFLGTAAGFALTGRGVAAEPPAASLRPVARGDDLHKLNIPEAADIIRKQDLTGRVSYAVARADTGEWLECENETVGTPPASTAKAITALYALGTLGADHRFETRLSVTGGIVDGVVQGDLVLIGGGDPTLDTDTLGDMAAKLKAAGVRSVKGGFKVFEAALPVQPSIDPEQPDHVGYNPGVSGIALNYNRVHFEWKRGADGYDVTMEGRSDRFRPAVAMAAMQVRDRSTPVYTYESRAGRDEWTVAKAALGSGGARWLPVRKPGLYAGDIFVTLAGSHGIRLQKPDVVDTLSQGEVIVTQTSDVLRTMLKDMLTYSTNLTAEMIGMSATVKRVGMVDSLRASAEEMNRWAIAELGMQTPQLVDHSGLGDDSRMTTLDMATAMVKMRDSDLRPILKQFVLRDSKGRPVNNHPIRVDAKTGTLNFVSGLAGYVTALDGTVLAFAILAADPKIRATISREEREGPPGARAWNGRAKRAQQGLLERWGAIYSA